MHHDSWTLAADLTDLPGQWSTDGNVLSAYGGIRDLWWAGDMDHLLVVRDTGDDQSTVNGFGSPEPMIHTLNAIEAPRQPVHEATLPRGVFESPELGAEWLAMRPGTSDQRWEHMACRASPPPVAAEERVVELDASWYPAIRELLAVANPTTHHAPGDQNVIGWWGIPFDDADNSGRPALAAVVGALRRHRADSRVHSLAAVGPHPQARRRGLGRAAVTAATRAGLRSAPFAMLGLWSSNDQARRMYRDIGYQVVYEATSRELDVVAVGVG